MTPTVAVASAAAAECAVHLVPFMDVTTADALLCFSDGRYLPCHSQLLALWSVVFRELLSTFGYSVPTAAGAASEVRIGTGTATMTAAASSDNGWVCTRYRNRASTVTTALSEGPPSGPTAFTPGSVTVSTSASGILHIPLVGEDSLEEWLRVLELMYPPTCLPRPTIGWENIEVVIVLADKYGMPGLLLLCEEFLLGRGSGGGGGGSRAGGGKVFSCEAEDPAYVWKWLRRADRLRMERVCDQCIDFICSEAMLGHGGSGTAVRGEADEEVLQGLRSSTLRRLVGHLVSDTVVMKAALRNEGMKVSTAVSWSYSSGISGGSSLAGLTEHRSWQLAVADHQQCRWRAKGS